MPRIAVVGAGLSGLSTARSLAGAGHEVTVFEKARGAGGRAATRRVAEHAFDHGAQYFTCRDPRSADRLADWRARGIAARWRGAVRTLCRAEVGAAGEDAPRYVGVPGMSALARDLARGITCRFGVRIAALEPSAPASSPSSPSSPSSLSSLSSGWRLRDDAGEGLGAFDAVVLSVPAPQALPLLAAVPALARRVAAVEMEPCQAVMAELPERLEVPLDGAFVSDSPLGWVARNGSKPGRPAGECWVLHAGVPWSRAHLEDPPEQVVQALLAAFAEALGREVPPPLLAIAHRWRYARGGPLGEPHLWDGAARVGLCGDWLEGGRVERALLSGEGLAEQLAAEL